MPDLSEELKRLLRERGVVVDLGLLGDLQTLVQKAMDEARSDAWSDGQNGGYDDGLSDGLKEGEENGRRKALEEVSHRILNAPYSSYTDRQRFRDIAVGNY